MTFELLTPKSIEIIYGSWSTLLPRNVYLGEISMKSMSGQDFAYAGQIDRHTEGLTDGRCVP